MKKIKFIAALFALTFSIVGAFAFQPKEELLINSGAWSGSCNANDPTVEPACFVDGSGPRCTISSNLQPAYETGTSCQHTLNINQ